jgi:hypothetical protein
VEAEKLLPEKFAEMKLCEDVLETTFSYVEAFHHPILAAWEEK